MRSAEKVLRILLLFSPEHTRHTAESIARGMGLPLSSTYRYLATLRKVGLIEDGGDDTLRISPIVIGLARAAYGALDLVEIAQPFMERLSYDSGETALLFRRSADRAVCIGIFESRAPVRFAFDVGAALSLDQGAAPKLLLANAPLDEQARIIAKAVRDSAASIDADALREELTRIRGQGWAETSGEITSDVYAVAAVVTSRRKVIATVSVAGLAYRLVGESRNALRESVLDTAHRLSKAYDESLAYLR